MSASTALPSSGPGLPVRSKLGSAARACGGGGRQQGWRGEAQVAGRCPGGGSLGADHFGPASAPSPPRRCSSAGLSGRDVRGGGMALPVGGGVRGRPGGGGCRRGRAGAVGVRASSSRESRGWGGAEEKESRAVQQMLVDLVRIQLGEAQVNQLVEEESRKLRSIARDSNEQLDQIAIRAMKGADEFSRRVLQQLDASALAIERDLIQARQEMEAKEREFEKFERRVYQSRNEGLFFQSLNTPPKTLSRHSRSPHTKSTLSASKGGSGQPSRLVPSAAGAAAEVLLTVGDDAGLDALASSASSSVYKQVLYGGLALVMVSFLWSSASAMLAGHGMRVPKLAAYGAIFTALLLQIKYYPLITGLDHAHTCLGEQQQQQQAGPGALRASAGEALGGEATQHPGPNQD